jgi:SAM-dependent methyltransferase
MISHLKLDFGCGQHPKEEFDGVDVCESLPVAWHVNLLKFPLPWSDSAVDEIWCSHFIEHIPAREVTPKDLLSRPDCDLDMIGQDMFFAFFDECFRILKPGGKITLVWPGLQTARAFKDPTHRRFIPLETMDYLNATWRKNNGLSHYRTRCNFTPEVPGPPPKPNEKWNCMRDYQVTLLATK